MSEISVG
jgi:hypothetical protein